MFVPTHKKKEGEANACYCKYLNWNKGLQREKKKTTKVASLKTNYWPKWRDSSDGLNTAWTMWFFQQMTIKIQMCTTRMLSAGPPPPASGYIQLPRTPGEIFQAAVFPISVTPEMIKWTMKLSCKCAARLQSAIWIVLEGMK